MKEKITLNKNRILFMATMVIGCFFRLFYIGNIPGNRNVYVDEAICGYEAWSLVNYGYDYYGYPLPVYLPSWDSGQSLLQALCQMPFVKLFGLNSFAIRLPAAILGCVTLYAFYYICKKIKDEEFAIFALFILSVMPWHIMQSRWSMDCNFYCGVITIAFALLIKACEDKRFLPISFVVLGLSLYAYALPWTIMPILVLGITAYLVYMKKIRIDKYLVISYIILALLALPLMLFVLVNLDIIPEIVTPLFSIPRLGAFRSDEIILSAKDVIKNTYRSINCFITQDDGLVQDVTPMFGLFYKFSNIIILIGIAHSFINFWNNRKRNVQYEFMFLLLFVLSLFIASTTEVSFYRMNMILIPLTYFLADGLYAIIDIAKSYSKQIVIFIYSVSCLCFLIYYVAFQDDILADVYKDGLSYALDYVHKLKDSDTVSESATVHIISDISFVSVLFIENYPTDKYLEEVVYEDRDVTGLNELAKSFGYYEFYYNYSKESEYIDGDVYICDSRDYELVDYLESQGMELSWFSNVVVAVN